jgi:hypothetical protein
VTAAAAFCVLRNFQSSKINFKSPHLKCKLCNLEVWELTIKTDQPDNRTVVVNTIGELQLVGNLYGITIRKVGNISYVRYFIESY